MPSTATPPARKRSREVLNVKISPQIASVYAGLNGDNLVLCGHPTALMNMPLKSPAIAISQFGYRDGKSSKDGNQQPSDGAELHT